MRNIEERIRKFGIENVTQEKFDSEPKINSHYIIARHYLNDEDYEKWKKAQIRNNPYCPEYVSKRDNISIEEATVKIEEYKKNKATSKEGFLKRHGKEKGEEIFQKFRMTSDSKSLEFHIAKYGEEEGKIQFEKRSKEGTRRRVEFFIKRGCTIEEAKEMVSEHQKNNSGVHRHYYLNKGYSREEIDEIFSLMNQKRSIGNRGSNPNRDTRSVKVLKLKYGENWEIENKKIYEKLRNTMEDKGIWTPLYLMEERRKYNSLVHYYTLINLKKVPESDKRSREYHVDHKYSKYQGFKDGIDPKIIGSEHNLEMLPRTENSRKNIKCSITLEELYSKYYGEYKNENKEIDSREFWTHIRY